MGIKRHVMPAVLTMMVAAAGAVPAQAAVFDKGGFTFEDSGTEDICGREVRHESRHCEHARVVLVPAPTDSAPDQNE